MDFNEYQDKAIVTAVYPASVSVIYPALGLANEAGEVLGKLKKRLRGDGMTVARANEAAAADFFIGLTEEELAGYKSELGDVLWYLAALAEDLGIDLQDVAELNIAKLQDRYNRGVIKGSGDNR